MKTFFVSIFCLLSVSPLLAQEIKIYTWEYFLSDAVIADFTKKTGHSIKQYYFDNEVDRNAMLMNGQANQFDLILVDNVNTQNFGKLNKLQAITQLHIANQEHNDKISRRSCGSYGIPYAKGTLGIVHRTSVTKGKVDSWHDLLSPAKEHIGRTIMLKSDIGSIAIALLAQGINPFTESREELKLAYALLTEQSKFLLEYAYPISYVSEHGKSSTLSLAPAYSGDLFNIKELSGQDDWEYIVPKEGTLLFVDCFTLPAEKSVKEATKAFLSFINEPQIAAKNAQDIWFSTTNSAAQLLTSEKYKTDSELNPDKATILRSYNYKKMSQKGTLLRNKITSMLSIQE